MDADAVIAELRKEVARLRREGFNEKTKVFVRLANLETLLEHIEELRLDAETADGAYREAGYEC